MSDSASDIHEKLIAAYRPKRDTVIKGRLGAVLAEAQARDVDPATIDSRLASWAALFPFRRAAWATADDAIDDLRVRVLSDPATRSAKFSYRLRTFAGWVFDHYIAVGSLVAITASALYGLAYARFYAEMSITPEQAGLSTTQIVANSATGGLALVLLISVMLFLVFLPAVAPREDLYSQDESGTWLEFAQHLALSLLGIVGLIGLAEVFGLDGKYLGPAVGVSVGLALMGLGFHWQGFFSFPLHPKPMDFSIDKYLIILVSLALPVALLGTGVLTVVKAGELGRRASSGEAVREAEILQMPILGVRAEPALIRWRTTRLPDFPDCALYLGAANGQIILHDHLSGSTVEIPSDNVDLVFHKQMSSCEAPVDIGLPQIRHSDRDHLECRPGRWDSDGVEKSYAYEWLYRGDAIQHSRVVDVDKLLPRPVVRCEVEVSTVLGSNTATSEAVVAQADHEPAKGG